MLVQEVDVVIVGYGPTGMTLAALLAQKGRTVAVLERYDGLFNLPRAAAFDDETMRTFQKLGIAEKILPGANVQPGYIWKNAAGDVLLDIRYDNPGRNGWPAQYMVYQPHLEKVLDDLNTASREITVYRSATVSLIEEDAEGVVATCKRSDGSELQVRGRYLVGADGGNSFVRQHLGVGWQDFGLDFSENWLVTDFKLKYDIPGLPTFQQVCNPHEPIAIVNTGPGTHRFSFRLESDVTAEDVTSPEYVWPKVADYISPENADLIRVANYRFKSLMVDRWLKGRVLLAGDAAHQMPPFLAQGMVSGIRDSRNLAWKLDAVLSGAPAQLLETYQEEREPHVRFITEWAIQLGRVQTERDPAKAAERDARMLAERAADRAPNKLTYPGLSGDMIANDGSLLPQGLVSVPEQTALLDDIAGTGWLIVATGHEALEHLSERDAGDFRRIGGSEVVFGISSMYNPGPYSDSGGVYTRYFAENHSIAAVVRPDSYVFGLASDPAELANLVRKVVASLGAARLEGASA